MFGSFKRDTSMTPKLAALDTVRARIMIADDDLTITYMNPAVVELMREVEADLRKELPRFSPRHPGRQQHRRLPQEPDSPAEDAGRAGKAACRDHPGRAAHLRPGGQPAAPGRQAARLCRGMGRCEGAAAQPSTMPRR
ncbi:PAS domain-containing protein [Dankookia sp. P2]|uniref:PAS domain-containing protein n=1 Tax=Dankookia sp. P2 TaxID=3423955 RepID=UPI003D664902